MDAAASTAFRRLVAATAVLLTVFAVLSLAWSMPVVGRTFPGFLTTSGLRINGVLLPSWTGAQAGLPIFCHVRSADGRPLADGPALVRYVASLPPGRTVTYGIEAADGTVVPVPVRTMRFGLYEWLAVCLVHWLVGVGIAVIGVLVAWLQPQNPLARFFFAACTLMSVLYLGVADATTTYHLVSETATMLNMSWAGGCFGILSAVFPRRWAHARRWQIAWLVAILGLSAWFLAEQAWGGDRAIVVTCMVLPSLGVLSVPVGAAWTALSPESTQRQRHQGHVLLIGTLVTFALPISMYVAEYLLSRPLPGMDLCQLAILAFPATIGYAIVRHRLFDIDLALRRTLTYALVAGVLLAVYAAITGIAHALAVPPSSASGLLVTAVIAVAFAPLRDGVKRWLDKRFFRQPYDLVAVAEAFQHEACERMDVVHLLATFVKTLDRALNPRYVAVTLASGETCHHGEPETDEAGLSLPLTFGATTLGRVTIGPKRSDLPLSPLDTTLIHDLTQRLAILVHLAGRLASELEQRQTINALRQADEMRNEFLNVVSHELRRPLGEMMASVNILARYDGAPPPDRLAHHLLQLKASGGALSRLVNDLLDAGMLQSGHFRLRPAPLTVSRVIDDAVRAAGPLAEQRGVTLVAEPQPCPPAYGDHLRLVQVVSNLLTNAIRHTPPGGRVTVRSQAGESDWSCDVVDTGDGIDAAAIPALFQRFSRLDPDDGSGIGLGLYICKAIVEAHQGRIEVQSQPSHGSTFRFHVPLRGPQTVEDGVSPHASTGEL